VRYNDKTQRYGRWEVSFDADVKEITVTAPSGESDIVETFLKRPGKLVWDIHGYEAVVQDGEPYLCARYTAREAGTYLFAADNGENGSFYAEDTGNHGYLGVGKTDPRYFSFTDGTPFPIIGVNLASLTPNTLSSNQEFGLTSERGYLGVREYERWFKKLSRTGGNHARIWLGQEYLNPDTNDPREFDLLQFEKLDAIIELARKYGIYLKLTFDQFRFFGKSQYDAVYNEASKRIFGKEYVLDGERCESMTRWLNEDKWRKCWIEKIKTYLRRYAGDPIVMVFEFWNEMNAVEAPYDDVLEWNRYMADQLEPLAPYNMWSQSLGSMDAEQNIEIYRKFPFEKFSFSQFHRYLDQGVELEECRKDGFVFTKTGIANASVPGKPVILAETGGVNDCHSGPFRYYMSDDRGIIFADTVFPAFFLGAAGCGQIWHWNTYVENKCLFDMLRPFADAVNGVQLEKEDFRVRDLSDNDIWAAVLIGNSTVLGYIRNKQDSWYNTLRDGSEPKAITEISISLNAPGELHIHSIWHDEPANVFLHDGTIVLRNMKYGLIFRIDRDK